MPTEKWYYIANSDKKGPFTIEELKVEQITANTLVWSEKMSEWEKAKHVILLKEILVPEPPPIPGATSSHKEEHLHTSNGSDKKETSYFGYELASRKKRFFASLTEAILIALFAAMFIYSLGYDMVERPLSERLYTTEDVLLTIILSIIIGALFYPMCSGNLGHRIFGLKVISSETGKDYNTSVQGATREFLKGIMALVVLPVLWILFDPNKQNLYDKITKTLVVKRKD